jgi:tetratricopeptide (TPR) repeat protein
MSSAMEPLGASNSQKLKAKTLFEYGSDALVKNNIDYAIQMFTDACKLDPAHLPYRNALRMAERRKFGNEPSKVSKFVGVRTKAITTHAKRLRSKGEFAQAIESCEEAFAHNPWDVQAAKEAAEAAELAGWKALAQWFLESVQLQASDVDFFRFLAHVHELNHAFDKAILAWQRVKQLHPNDEDANKQINALAASATIHRSGLTDAVNKRAETAITGSLPAEAEDLKKEAMTPEKRLLKELNENPTLVGPYLQLADFLKGRGKLDDAEKLLAKGLKVIPEDPSLRQAYAEVQIARLQRAIASYTEKVKAQPGDADARAKLDQLQAKHNEYEVNEFRRRMKLYPGDLKLHYELGLRLARAGRHGEAIGEFQQALNTPSLKVPALHQLGQSFEAEGRLKLAERNYEEAIKALDPGDRMTFCALHYRLGRVCEVMGNNAAAEEHYNEVAAIDYNYLDVAQRLKNLS